MTAWLNISATEGSSSASDVNDCYTFHDVDSTWNEARAACREMGAHLVTMETVDEWKKVKGFVKEKVKETGSFELYYIGLHKENGAWKWIDAGSPGVTVAIDDSRWRPGQPSPREENCGEIWYPKSGTQGHFNDVYCNRKLAGTGGAHSVRGYICENY